MDPVKKREEDYWMCRRAVRIHPANDGNKMEAVRTYLKDCLKMSESTMSSLGLESATYGREGTLWPQEQGQERNDCLVSHH